MAEFALLIGGVCLGWILAQVYDTWTAVRGRKNSGWLIQRRLERERQLQDINERRLERELLATKKEGD